MRDEFYLNFINESIQKLLTFQDTRPNSRTSGCFFYPFWRLRKESYINSRWQEAVLTLSWFYNKYNSEELWEKIIKSIDFWCELQNKDGSFPEHSKFDHSFSATAFSTLAVLNSIIILNYSKENWIEKITKSCEYLMKNDELILINQEAAAALALLKFGNYKSNIRYLKESERKLDLVLKNQSKKGYYLEMKGFDFGYSSLTLEILGHYYLATLDEKILNSASRFIDFVNNLDFKFIRNVRHTNWMISGGFEIFSQNTKNGKNALQKILNNFNIKHLESDKNYCTDLYRLCYAYDNYKEDLDHRNLEEDLNAGTNFCSVKRPSKLLNFLRPFGLHRFRRFRYFFS